jgi:signal transduction histidine kinase
VLRPVDVLAAAARRISTGALATRANATTGPVELRQLAATFNGMAQAVELAMQRQEAFVADASHQLRNPLSALVLQLEALGMALDEEQRQQLKPAQEEATRLGAILNELLDLATAVHLAAQPDVIDVGDLVRARVDAWRPLADRRPVYLRAPAASTAPVEAWADPVLVSSALDSVLDNAVKFSPTEGDVVVLLAADATTVRIDIVDEGPGLSAEDLAHIGDRFWRGSANQNIPGCGLGLSIARALLDATGGTLTFATVDPHGLHVTLCLSRVAAGEP